MQMRIQGSLLNYEISINRVVTEYKFESKLLQNQHDYSECGSENNSTIAEEHIEFHSSQAKTGIWG